MNTALLAVPFVVSAALLFAIYSVVPFAEVGAVLGTANSAFLAATLPAVAAVQLVIALRLRVLTLAQGFRLGLRRVISINLASHFYKLIFPGGMATFIGVRSFKLYRAEKKAAGALWASVSDRFLATTGLALAGLICWLLDPGAWNHVSIRAFGVLLVTVVAAGALLLSRKSARLLSTQLARLVPGARADRITSGLGALQQFREMPGRDLLVLIVTALVPHVLGILIYWLVARACGITLDAVTLGWIRSAAVLAVMVPVSVGGLGIRDSVLIALFSLYSIPVHITVAFALLVFSATVLLPALAGGLVEIPAILRLAHSK